MMTKERTLFSAGWRCWCGHVFFERPVKLFLTCQKFHQNLNFLSKKMLGFSMAVSVLLLFLHICKESYYVTNYGHNYDLIYKQFHFYRHVTCILLHVDWIHLINNMSALNSLSQVFEDLSYTSLQLILLTILILVIDFVLGWVVWICVGHLRLQVFSVGYSGVLYGYLVFVMLELGNPVFTWEMLFNMLMGDFLGHLTGALSGALAYRFFILPANYTALAYKCVVLAVLLLVVYYIIQKVIPSFWNFVSNVIMRFLDAGIETVGDVNHINQYSHATMANIDIRLNAINRKCFHLQRNIEKLTELSNRQTVWSVVTCCCIIVALIRVVLLTI